MKRKCLLALIIFTLCVGILLPATDSAAKATLQTGSFSGTFTDVAGGKTDATIDLEKKGKKYVASIGILRLCEMDDMTVKVKKDNKVTVKGLDPAGDPIVLTGKLTDTKLRLKTKQTTWTYFSVGDVFLYRVE